MSGPDQSALTKGAYPALVLDAGQDLHFLPRELERIGAPVRQRRQAAAHLCELVADVIGLATARFAVVFGQLVPGDGGDEGHAPARRSYEKAGYTGLPLVRYYKDL